MVEGFEGKEKDEKDKFCHPSHSQSSLAGRYQLVTPSWLSLQEIRRGGGSTEVGGIQREIEGGDG